MVEWFSVSSTWIKGKLWIKILIQITWLANAIRTQRCVIYSTVQRRSLMCIVEIIHINLNSTKIHFMIEAYDCNCRCMMTIQIKMTISYFVFLSLSFKFFSFRLFTFSPLLRVNWLLLFPSKPFWNQPIQFLLEKFTNLWLIYVCKNKDIPTSFLLCSFYFQITLSYS